MFSFDQLKIHQIPVGENRNRIDYLTNYRDLLNTAFGWPVRTDWQLSDLEQRRTSINEGKPLVHRMITLAGIKTVRQCVRRNVSSTIKLDVVDELWSLEQLFVSTREPITAIEEAIGEYKRNQKKARWRTWSPLFWATRFIEWIIQFPVWLLSLIFSVEEHKVARSWYGRLLSGVFWGTCALVGAVQALSALLDHYGLEKPLLRWLGFK
jgi:hypothetical protein